MKLINSTNPKSSVKTILRWLLVLPSVLIAFYLCVLVAVGIHWLAESLCPAELIVSELCTAAYMNWVKEGLLLVMPAIASALMVLFAYICAPNHKLQIALLIFITGSIAAIYYAFESNYWLTLVLTELSGSIALFLCYKTTRHIVD